MGVIHLAALACSGEKGVTAALRRASEQIEQVCYGTTDVICLPEIFAWTSLSPEERRQAAEPLDGPFSRAMAALAAKHRVHILTPLVELDGAKMYNTMVWYDRAGEILGTYRKVFPTIYEMDEGFTPGSLEFDVFHTEFGPIGCCVCFDLNFPEVVDRIAAQGAKLVIHPTMFDSMVLMQAWAKLRRMYFLSVAGEPYGTLVDPLGKPLIDAWRHRHFMSAAINLDYIVLHSDGNQDKLPAIRKALGDSVHIDWRYIESAILLESRDADWPVERIVEHWKLEREADLYDRTRAARRSYLDGSVSGG